MSQPERERLKLFERVKRHEMSLKEAAEICGLSYRQTRRLFKRYREVGDRGLVHQGRGRPSIEPHPAAFKAKAEEETSFAPMELLWRWIYRYGIPQSLYTDKKNVHVIDEKTRARAADSGEEVWTHFGWACKQLGIEIITAHSPQAKGRVERNHGFIRIAW